MSFSIRFGGNSPPIKAQLPPGLTIDPFVLGHFQRDADAITRLMNGGYASTEQAETMRRKLFERIQAVAKVAA